MFMLNMNELIMNMNDIHKRRFFDKKHFIGTIFGLVGKAVLMGYIM